MVINIKQELRRLLDSFEIVSGTRYYSQLAEDAILAKFFYRVKRKKTSSFGKVLRRENIAPGFYIDIGAYSPKIYSNTYFFYKNGWSGITVEPNPNSAKWFRIIRSRDIHLNFAIGDIEDGRLYYHTNGYSTENFISNNPKIVRANYFPREIKIISLKDLFIEYVPKNLHVDLLSIDCEGSDLSILKTNDWSAFRPSVVVAETPQKSEITDFMKLNNYSVLATTIGSVIYKDNLSDKLSW